MKVFDIYYDIKDALTAWKRESFPDKDDPGAYITWYRNADREQHNENNIFPPAMEDREALELLIHYLLPEGWYSTLPAICTKQILTEIVEEILYANSKRYRMEVENERKRNE